MSEITGEIEAITIDKTHSCCVAMLSALAL